MKKINFIALAAVALSLVACSGKPAATEAASKAQWDDYFVGKIIFED